LLAGVLLSLGIIATTTRSASLVITTRLACGLDERPRDDETFPALGHWPFPWCHHPCAGADIDCTGPLLSSMSIGLRPCGNGLGCSFPHDPFLVGAMSTLQCSLSAAASSFARPPDGSDRHRRPRGLSSELAPSSVTRC